MILLFSCCFLPFQDCISEIKSHSEWNRFQEGSYVITDYFEKNCNYYKIIFLLIFNTEIEKYNTYILEITVIPETLTSKKIVENCAATSLENAQKIFPKYKLCKENYGF